MFVNELRKIMIYEVYKDLTAPLHIWYHYKRRNREGGENGKTVFSSRAQIEEQLYKMPRFALFVRRAADSARDVRAEGCARFLGPEALARRRVRTGQNVHFVSGATAPRHRARRIKSDRG